ncbi:hypothetical protein J9K13_002738 [Salmonella enterica]|nr:hypothetical protein [Salmonella enterica]HEC8456400.1 hypothetical protein [Salmonella enterica subsp. enterica serovar Poona]
MGQGTSIVQEGQQGTTERQYPVTGVRPEVRESEQRLHTPASSDTEVKTHAVDLMRFSCV